MALNVKAFVVWQEGTSGRAACHSVKRAPTEAQQGCCERQMVAQRTVPNLAEPVQKESFARHTILIKPTGPRVGKEEDGSWHQELTKAWKYTDNWKLQEAKLIYEETMREDSRRVGKGKIVKGPLGHAKE